MGLLQRSITAGILIASILILRCFTFRKLSKRVFTVLWKMAIVRLLLPFSFQVESALFHTLSGRNVSHVMLQGRGGELKTPMDAASLGIGGWIGFIYPLGAIFLTLVFALEYAKVCILLREAIPVSAFTDIGRSVGKCRKDLTKRVSIVVTDRIKTPMTYGLLHPRIVLPNGWTGKMKICFRMFSGMK